MSYQTINKFLTTLFFMSVASCVQLQRHPASGYAQPVQPNDYQSNNLPDLTNQLGSPNELNYKLMADLGITPNALNQPEIRKKYDLHLAIKNSERFLKTDREKKQYYSSIPWFKDDTERMEFLNQPGYNARLLWMRNKGFGKRPIQIDEDSALLIEKKDVALGMSQEHVRKSWGPPDAIEIAGSSLFKNERWKYKRYVSSSEGYKLQKRIVYFEGGKLVGWEQLDE
jgi:hypothetical protein